MKHGKNFNNKQKLVDRKKFYKLAEALQLLQQTKVAKFDETVDLAMALGVDIKKNPSIRGTVSLPAGSGKTKKIAVITKADRANEAQGAGADVVGAEDLVEKIKNGFMDFDVLIATPDMMPVIGKLGKILGTKGLMPNPKSGTVTDDIAKTVKEFKGGKVEFKMDKGGALHMVLGKTSFSPDDLAKNLKAALAAINHVKPSGLKGAFIKSITISSTMGPGIKLETKSTLDEALA